MSICVFVIGMGVTVAAVWQMVSADDGGTLLGPGTSLVAGLTAMLAVIYTGPLKNVRDSVSDLAQASVGFITFMHRLQFVTSLTAADFADGRATYQSLGRTLKFLGDAATDTIVIINAVKNSAKRSRKVEPIEPPDGTNIGPPVHVS